jgi:hypothetical protein
MARNLYHRLTVGEKQARSARAMAEPPVACPACETGVPPTELLDHMAKRCTGPREPHRLATWIGWSAALAIVPAAVLSRWVAAGSVRTSGEPGPDRRFLLRDLVQIVAREAMIRGSIYNQCARSTGGSIPAGSLTETPPTRGPDVRDRSTYR